MLKRFLFLWLTIQSPVCGPACENYLAAVHETISPQPSDVANSLVAIDPGKPVQLVTWTRSGALKDSSGAWLKKAPYDIWVTVVPNLKSFCQSFTKAHAAKPDELTLRLEQRLGLPPGGSKDIFVEIMVKKPSSPRNLFRPCMDPSVTGTTCRLGPPAATVTRNYRDWIYSQYYNSFGVARQYPWTSLGYTFDWAPDDTHRSKFVRVGESEFVIPRGASIQIQSATPTARYCSP